MKKTVYAGFALLVMALVAFFLWTNSQDKNNPTDGELTDVTIAQTGDFLLYSVLYVALDAGIFEDNGLDVSITSTGGDEKSVAAVIAGQAQFGVGDPTFAAIAKERGQDVKVVASIVNGVPFWGLTYSDEVAQRFASNGLDGLRVTTFPSPSTAYTLQKDMFEDAGLTPNIVEGAFGSLIGILESGQADIALELEPNVSTASERGATVLYSLTDVYGDFAITGMTVLGEYAERNPDTVTAMITSLQSSMDFMRADPERTLDILDNRFPELGNSVVESSLNRMVAETVIPSSTRIQPSSWEKAVDVRIEVGDISNREVAISALDNSWNE